MYDLLFNEKFRTEFPLFSREELPTRATFDPSVALDFESVEFLAFGHELVDALVARVMAREYGGRASHRIVRSNDVSPRSGWFFCYVLEHEGLVRSKEVFPVFISEGAIDEDAGKWMLDRTMRVKNEVAGGPLSGVLPDAWVRLADDHALDWLLHRQSELEVGNLTRLGQERSKLERFFAYRRQAAEEKLASTQRVFDRVSGSDDPDVQRIIPIWAKNLETAKRVISNLELDSRTRLAELGAHEQVTSRHELITASFVEIVPE